MLLRPGNGVRGTACEVMEDAAFSLLSLQGYIIMYGELGMKVYMRCQWICLGCLCKLF
ncbi:hypothetical protein KSS87_016309 [Heliosperma pusillum]|nr:hypothetical protein KSS87_016309 [Heliosperma pusillum]